MSRLSGPVLNRGPKMVIFMPPGAGLLFLYR